MSGILGFTLHVGDVRTVLAILPDGSVDCVVTSPPYWGLRDYGTPGQLGLEPTVDEYVSNMVAVFRQVRRVLAAHGTVWVNLGDSYAGGNAMGRAGSRLEGLYQDRYGESYNAAATRWGGEDPNRDKSAPRPSSNGSKPKDLIGVPWRVAFALQADGWWLRSAIVWAKPNPMPESVRDRPTSSYELVFLLARQPRYWFDAEAVREPFDPRWKAAWERHPKTPLVANSESPLRAAGNTNGGGLGYPDASGRNVRDVWQIATQPYPGAHFATFPEELARRCVVAGCPREVCRVCGKPRERIVERGPSSWEARKREGAPTRYGDTGAGQTAGYTGRFTSEIPDGANGGGLGWVAPVQTLGWTSCLCPPLEVDGRTVSKWRKGLVLDPFAGSGTTAVAALREHREAVGIELSAEYAEQCRRRVARWWAPPSRPLEDDQVPGQLGLALDWKEALF